MARRRRLLQQVLGPRARQPSPQRLGKLLSEDLNPGPDPEDRLRNRRTQTFRGKQQTGALGRQSTEGGWRAVPLQAGGPGVPGDPGPGDWAVSDGGRNRVTLWMPRTAGHGGPYFV